MPKAQFAFSYKWTFIWRGVYWHMCLHFDGATPTEWKEQGRSPIFLKNSQVHSFFLFVFQFQITIYSRNCLFLIYTKWLWFKPKQTEKAELPIWLIVKVIQKSDLFVPPRENRSWNPKITMFNLYMMRTQYVWSTNTKARVSPKSLQQRTHWSQSWSFQKRIGDIWEIVT